MYCRFRGKGVRFISKVAWQKFESEKSLVLRLEWDEVVSEWGIQWIERWVEWISLEIPQHNTTGNKRYYRDAQSLIQLPDVRIKASFRQLVCIRMHEQDAREMAVLVAALLLIGSASLGTSRGNVWKSESYVNIIVHGILNYRTTANYILHQALVIEPSPGNNSHGPGGSLSCNYVLYIAVC